MTDYTLIHADCLPAMADMEAQSVDFIFTDPPYGHNNNNGEDLIGRIGLFRGVEYTAGSTSTGRPILNDGVEANDLFRSVLPEFKRLLPPGAICCCGGGGGPDPQFARWSLWIDEVLEFKQMVIWDKGPMGMGWHYRRSYETVLVAAKKGAAHRWYNETNKVENIIRPGDYDIRKIIPSASQHPTVKPVALAAHFISLHTRPGDLVFDPFAGSGTTGVAALLTGRRFIGIELDATYYAIAAKRLAAASQMANGQFVTKAGTDADMDSLPLFAAE